MVHARENAGTKEERYDLFSSLLDNTGDEDGTAKLTDDELMGTSRHDRVIWSTHIPGRKHIHLPAGWPRGTARVTSYW